MIIHTVVMWKMIKFNSCERKLRYSE